MVKGIILFSAVLLVSYLLVTGLEYVGRFGSVTRLFLLVSFILVNGYLLVVYLLTPIFKLNKLGQTLSIWDAADMIGRFFPDISDKLKNTLQLERDSLHSEMNLELVRASIEQRSSSLSVVPFASAIDLRENRKYLKYLLILFGVFSTIAIVNPKWFFESTNRVINFNEEFVDPAPFEFLLKSKEEAIEGETYELEIGLKGNELPSEVKIVSSLGTYNLTQSSKTRYTHSFVNLSEDLRFYCEGNGYKSAEFLVHVLKKPVLEDISMKVIYPQHTGLSPVVFENSGDIAIPEGSQVEWTVTSRNLSRLKVFFRDTTVALNTSLTNVYSFKRRFLNSEAYTLVTNSPEIESADSLSYMVSVVKDQYPTISVTEELDTVNSLRRFIEGSISDDYGFRGLSAVVKLISKDTSYSSNQAIKINRSATSQLFSFYLDLSVFELEPGDKIEYYFTVTDNDEINGFKSATSGRKVVEIPSLTDLENNLSESSDNIEKDLDKALEDAEKLKKEIDDVQNQMMNKQNLDWKDKQSLENLLNLQKDLNKQIENLQTEYEKNNEERENFMEEDEELEAKREQLEKLMEELMDEELLELFKELEELLNEMNKDQLLQNLNQMEQKTDNLSEELDRTLELFKMMEVNEKLKSLEEQLRDLAEEQDELNQLTDDKKISPEELAEKQEELNKRFEEIQKDMDEIEQKNQDLERPMDINFDQEMEESVDQEMQNSKENLQENNRNKSQENQSKASEMMKQMADDVSSMQMQMSSEQQQEDMEALRYLLENIVALSKLQEGLMMEFKTTSVTDPHFNELTRMEQEIENASQVVKDSLVALSKRVMQLSSFITEELADLDYNLESAIDYAEDHKSAESQQSQQYVMTGYNNLALMLSEVLNQMQQQMQQQMPGNGSCSNPGGQGKGASDRMSMQQMKDALQQQINQMKGGQKPGGQDGQNQSGQAGGQNPGSIPGLSNKDVVKMAAQQSMIRESLKQMKEELNKDGSGAGNGLDDLIEDIDQLEKDLLNGNVGSDFVRRQEDILTRLLEHEKAMRERGYSDERQSEEGKNPSDGNLIEFTEYNRKKYAEAEFLRSLPIGLQVYYKTLVNEYFNSVNN